MRLRLLVAFLALAAFATIASAQTKISGTLSCGKADPVHSIETGDGESTVMNLVKVQCTWSKSLDMAGVTAKDGYSVAASETHGGKTKEHGIHVGTMANGDKYYVHFSGTGTVAADHSGSASGTWTFEGGTGKLKGLTGKGTYKSKNAADGTGTADIEGEYKTP
jgi:hypothetical protein